MNNANIVLTRIDVPNPPEPVLVFPASSIDANGGYRAAGHTGPVPHRRHRHRATRPFSQIVNPAAGTPVDVSFSHDGAADDAVRTR